MKPLVSCSLSILAEQLTMTGPSAVVLVVLLLLLAIAGGTFYALVWRETSARRSVALEEWAQATGFYSNPLAKLRAPHPLERFGKSVHVRRCYVSPSATVVEFTVDPPPGSVAAATTFHVLIWPVESDWPAVALRPVLATLALSDMLPLPSQAAKFGSHRFVIHTDHRSTGAHLATSRIGGLMPADIGLILIGRHMLVDFSCRPFDGIEFNRMISVAKQVVAHLPPAR